jgi:hypothetical protein
MSLIDLAAINLSTIKHSLKLQNSHAQLIKELTPNGHYSHTVKCDQMCQMLSVYTNFLHVTFSRAICQNERLQRNTV